MPVVRRLAAILAADVAGYSRLMGADEEGTLKRLNAYRRAVVDPKIAENRGRIVKSTGDGLLVEFPSVVDAVRCAVEVQRAMAERNTDVPVGERVEFRVGINLGDVIVEDDDIYGDGVNVAARLESLAEPGGVFISNIVYEEVRDRLPFDFDDIGEQRVKNIARLVRVYRVPIRENASARAPLPAPDKPSPAVLPFQNMSGDPEQDYFADGIVEEITTAIARLPWLFVIARNSSFTYKGRAVDVKQVARELGVRYVLEGKRAQGRQPRSPHRSTHRHGDCFARLGGPLRRCARRHLRASGPDGERCRRRDRATAAAFGDGVGDPQADGAPRRLRSLPSRSLAITEIH
jgi:adenylate cyclase